MATTEKRETFWQIHILARLQSTIGALCYANLTASLRSQCLETIYTH
jgi:hypothetical protein